MDTKIVRCMDCAYWGGDDDSCRGLCLAQESPCFYSKTREEFFCACGMDEVSLLIGKTIKSAVVNGDEVRIVCSDGIELNYSASDGGYSTWEITRKKD